MENTMIREGNRLTVKMEGRLDATTSNRIETELLASLDGVTELILDMEKLEYISSTGLRALLSTEIAMNEQGTMELAHVSDEVMMVLEVTGFAKMLTIRK